MGYILNGSNDLYIETMHSDVFVDKTSMIALVNKQVKTTKKYLCVSRPRRFGKTVTANMLVAYYSLGCDSKDLFSDLQIAQTPGYEKYLNQFNVLHLTMTHYSNMSIEDMEKSILKQIYRDIERDNVIHSIPNVDNLSALLEEIHFATKTPFIIIIDEWDCLMRKIPQPLSKIPEYLDFLRNLLKDREYIALVYMTGILPIRKYGEHSALNMFREHSMTNQGFLASYTGFTDEEVQGLCSRFSMDYDTVKNWYDGYYVEGVSVYNPNSLVEACDTGKCSSYWTQTETFEALEKYILLNIDGLHDKIERLIAGARIQIKTNHFKNDMDNLSSADDVLTLLIHLGYLTYDADTSTCWIPNQELMYEFITCIEDRENWKSTMEKISLSEQCLKATLSMDEGTVEKTIEKIHMSKVALKDYNVEIALSFVLQYAYFTAERYYEIVPELPTGKGFADLAFFPLPKSSYPALILELKREDVPSAAIAQIKDRQYFDRLRRFSGEVLLVGISYKTDPSDPVYKVHSCKIEKLKR